MKVGLLDHLVEVVRMFKHTSVLGTFAFERVSAQFNRGYQRLSTRLAIRMQEKVMLIELQQREEKNTVCTEVGSSSKRVVYRKQSRCLEEGRGLVQPIYTVTWIKL